MTEQNDHKIAQINYHPVTVLKILNRNDVLIT